MRQFINKYKWIIIILCILVGIYFLWPIISDEGTEMIDTANVAHSAETVSRAIDKDASNQEEINTSSATVKSKSLHSSNGNMYLVYITGAVQSPGLYEVPSNSSVGDVIQGAGGALPYAAVESINMADTIESGDHIHVGFNFHGNPETLLKPQKININTATIKELDSLPGIGPTMAKRIDEYRQSKGAFTSIEDIKHVKGIGDGLFKKIRNKITV